MSATGDGAFRVLYDASRLIGRRNAARATGIDRVDIRYAAYLHENHRDDTSFIVASENRVAPLPARLAERLVEELHDRWISGAPSRSCREIEMLGRLAHDRSGLLAAAGSNERLRGVKPTIYLNASHMNLNNSQFIHDLTSTHADRMVVYIHDLIPIRFPEYVRAGDPETHRLRLLNCGLEKAVFLTNSEASAGDIQKFFDEIDIKIEAPYVLKIGVEDSFLTPMPSAVASEVEKEPFFVVLGTIEPRKNHMVLLHVWRQLVKELGASRVPKLHLIGKRGWNNEDVFRFLDTCPALSEVVVEVPDASDSLVRELVAGCRALLFPSHVEGWGMPLVEALSLGVPAIAADIPSLREAGGGVPDFVDPINGPGWREAVLEYARPDSVARAEQLQRVAAYEPPRWEPHIDRLVSVIGTTAKTLTCPDPDPDFDRAREYMLREPLERGAEDGVRVISRMIDDALEMGGWYAVQKDSKGRRYRWCGAETSAFIDFPGDPRSLRWIGLRCRTLPGVSLDRRSISVRVAGRPVSWTAVRDQDIGVSLLVISAPRLLQRSSTRLEFGIARALRPSEIGAGGDTRPLSFNVFELLEVHLSKEEMAESA